MYQTAFTSPAWTGDVIAYRVTQSETSGDLDLFEEWRASKKLEGVNEADRKIVTYDGARGKQFTWGQLSQTQQNLLGSNNMRKYLRPIRKN